jgi:GNAT superfamily N-acetyltransferase
MLRSLPCMFIRASDGLQLYVRHVKPRDKDLIAKGWLQLSEETQRRRFLAPKPVLTKSDLRYLTEIDGHDHVALLALRLDDPKRLVAVARYVRLKDDPETAEVAVTVADEHQGKKIGTQLGVLLADEARGRGIRRFSGSMLADNEPALRLMRTMSQRLEWHIDHGIRDLVADLAA